MAILIDPPAWPAHGTLWSHLVSDTAYDELHAFASGLRLPRRSFDLDHYDLPALRYEQAVAFGARPVTAKDIVHRLRDSGLRVRQVDREHVRPVQRRHYLRAEWWMIGEHLGTTGTIRSEERWRDLGEALIARWNEPHRRYHDEQHLEDVLLALDHLSTRGERVFPATLLAAWFHDAVYTGATSSAGPAVSDEQASARLAAGLLSEFNLETTLVGQVSDFIVATTPTEMILDPVLPLAHLFDADLAIFASPQSRYEQYAQSVRTEYAQVPGDDFAAGRARILSRYLEQPTIYRTGAAQQLWEQRARVNVTGEIERLRLDAAKTRGRE